MSVLNSVCVLTMTLCMFVSSVAVAADDRLHVGIVDSVKPTDKESIQEATVQALRETFPEKTIVVSHLKMVEIEDAILDKQVDIYISSAGQSYRLQKKLGLRVLGALITPTFKNPNHADGTAILVLAEHENWNSLPDVKGKRLVVNATNSYTGYQIPMGEVAKLTKDWEHYFSKVESVGTGKKLSLAMDQLLAKQSDVAFAKMCFLETWQKQHPDKAHLIKVLNHQDDGTRACQYSTELYPSWTVAATDNLSPEDVRRAMKAIINMPADENGNEWGVSTDFVHIDMLYKRLRIGPYAYLRELTLRQFVEKYQTWIILIVILALGLVAHAWRTEILVRRRTAQLLDAMQEQRRLQEKADQMTSRVTSMQKIGMLGQISGMLAHEMRQPLATILFYLNGLQLLLGKGIIGPKEKLEEALGQMVAQTEKADNIVQHVREYARNQHPSGRRRWCRLMELLRETVEEFKTARKYTCAIPLDGPDDVWVHVDPLEISCAFYNLIKNAAEAVEKEPQGQIWLDVSADNDTVKVCVSDNGPRLTDEAFERLNSPIISTKTEGLGLGLSIVRGLAENYRGSLNFVRGVEGGITAILSLPCSRQVDEPYEN